MDDARQALNPKCPVDADKVTKAFRLAAKYKLVHLFGPHDPSFDPGIVSGGSENTNFSTLPWVIPSRTRSKRIVKLFSLSVNLIPL